MSEVTVRFFLVDDEARFSAGCRVAQFRQVEFAVVSGFYAPRPSHVTARWSRKPRVGLGPHGFGNRCPRSSRISSAMLIGDSRTSSAKGGLGRQDGHDGGDEAGPGRIGWRLSTRRSTAWVVRQAVQRTPERSSGPPAGADRWGQQGIRRAWRSCQATISAPRQGKRPGHSSRAVCRPLRQPWPV